MAFRLNVFMLVFIYHELVSSHVVHVLQIHQHLCSTQSFLLYSFFSSSYHVLYTLLSCVSFFLLFLLCLKINAVTHTHTQKHTHAFQSCAIMLNVNISQTQCRKMRILHNKSGRKKQHTIAENKTTTFVVA